MDRALNLRRAIFGALCACLVLSGCATDDQSKPTVSNETIGTVLGALGGALLGSQIGGGNGQVVAAIVGGAAGAWIGNRLGSSLDENARRARADAAGKAVEAPVGQSIMWSDPRSQSSGTVVPRSQQTRADGRVCREFEETIRIGSREETATATMCREPDGTWKAI